MMSDVGHILSHRLSTTKCKLVLPSTKTDRNGAANVVLFTSQVILLVSSMEMERYLPTRRTFILKIRMSYLISCRQRLASNVYHQMLQMTCF